ncbi:sorbitol dehydrogenase-like [Bradysia coprophila]|uniref:sorbitol dehydrogenase-like n=1 Tax=Bradysia coprophila TaxID=38358 RepID=UPI00187D8E6A|nr:sorbitol dehydrogenase-like [Bradysia coprophila]
MSTDNLSAVLYGINDLRLEQTPLPDEPGHNEVILESHTVGICGSDIHFLTEGRIGPFVMKEPLILGHESSATVVKVGPSVHHLNVGDRVAVEPQIPCRVCESCKHGHYNVCPDTKFFATPPYNGSLTRLYKHAADFCFKLPEHVSYEEASLMEPLAVAVHACRRAGVKTGDVVLVVGAGPIGMSSVLVAKAFGASKILVTDINAKRVMAAHELGADFSYVLKSGSDAEKNAEEIVALLGDAPHVTLECTGAAAAVSLALYATRFSGTVCLVGIASGLSNVPLIYAVAKEVTITTSLRYANCYPLALSLIAEGKVDPRPMITHRFDLEHALEAFETVKRGEGVKVMIKCKRE